MEAAGLAFSAGMGILNKIQADDAASAQRKREKAILDQALNLKKEKELEGEKIATRDAGLASQRFRRASSNNPRSGFNMDAVGASYGARTIGGY